MAEVKWVVTVWICFNCVVQWEAFAVVCFECRIIRQCC